MKKMRYVFMGLGLILGLAACEMRDELKKDTGNLQEDEGVMTLDLSSKGGGNVVVTKGSFADVDVNPDHYTIQILDAATEVVKKEFLYSELKTAGGQVKLTAGKYRVVAYNFDGSELNVSERPFFKGQTDFQVLAGKTTRVNTTCRLQNIEMSLNLSESFNNSFDPNYTIIVTNGEGGVYIYNQTNVQKKIYFKVPQKNATSLQLTVKATTKDKVDIAQSYSITKPANAENNSNLTSGDSFTVKLDPGDNPSVDPVTKIDLGITVDLTMIETGVTIEIPTENIIFNGGGENPGGGEETNKGPIVVEGLNKTYSYVSQSESVPTVQVKFSVPNGITKMMVTINSNNDAFMETLGGFGLSAPFDLANPGELLPILEGSLEDGQGIGLLKPGEVVKGKTDYLFDITHFIPLLGLYGASQSAFVITVSDGINADATGSLTIHVTAD